MGWLKNKYIEYIEKLNPAQSHIVDTYGDEAASTTNVYDTVTAYEQIEVVTRGVDLIVDSAADIDFDVKDKINTLGRIEQPIRPGKLDILLNKKPNPYIDVSTLRRNLYLDLILDGNAFIYFDGSYIYQLPAINTIIHTDKQTYISHYEYGETTFYPNELIHIKDNSAKSIFRGNSRLMACLDSVSLLKNMESFQSKFFRNNAIPGLVLKSPNSLSPKIKNRIINEWMLKYNPTSGGKRPAILDGDMSIEPLGTNKFTELDFAQSIEIQEKEILKALGVPPILLDSGNNANISPNLRMFYINTVLPCVNKVNSGLEHFFGYDLKPATAGVLALQPDLKELGSFYSSMVNNGIFTPNEAREELRKPKDDDESSDKLRIPQNIAGSAVDSNQGGKPPNEDNNK